MLITIENIEFDPKDIMQLYPAAVIRTGDGDETTQVSMQWIENEGKGKVDLVGYAIYVHLAEDDVHEFMYNTKEEMDTVSAQIAEQIKNRRDGR